jgi:glutamine---fructose-6-phosphate transaminase (isomerizing)
MDITMTGFATELTEQPAALRRTLDPLPNQLAGIATLRQQLESGQIKRVLLSGMGASYFATFPAQLYLLQNGVDTLCIEASELLHYQYPIIKPDTLLVLVSQSGRSVEIVRLLERNGGRAPVLAITNDASSPLGAAATACITTDAGEELTVSSKTYTCTVAALHVIARALLGEAVQPAMSALYAAADAIEAHLPTWQALAPQLVERIHDSQTILYLGRGISQASFMTGALITKESTKFPTEGMSAAQFRHGPMEMTDARISAYIFAGDTTAAPLNHGLAREMAALGARVNVVGEQAIGDGTLHVPIPSIDTWLLPLIEIVPIHCFAAKFAAQQGYVPGAFRYLGKVTTKE